MAIVTSGCATSIVLMAAASITGKNKEKISKIPHTECMKNEIDIFPIPGASAVSAAISISGFSDNFYFSLASFQQQIFLKEYLSQKKEDQKSRNLLFPYFHHLIQQLLSS